MAHEISDLIARWHHHQREGKPLSLAELCADCPEQLPALQRHLEAVKAMEAFLGSHSAVPTSPADTVEQGTEQARKQTSDATFPDLPGYEILDELGRGGMGVVYKARHRKLNQVVALKMILGGRHAAPKDHTRFLTEAEATAGLRHPHIVSLLEFGECGGLPFFTMEFVPGGSLAHRLKGIPLPPRQAARLIEQLARGIHHAHSQNIIHRDLKPDNVLLAEDGTPKITDFGLARRVEVGAGLTASGAVMGTPSYMAPEQARGETRHAGPTADVYGLGAILYECLTGRPPFKAATPVDTILQVLDLEAVSVRQLQPQMNIDLATICHKCLQKEPHKRYASALELAEDCAAFLAGKPIRARPVGKLEQGWRWCRRNPTVASLLSLVVLTLVAGVVVATTFAWQAERAGQKEAEARKTAQQQLVEMNTESGLTAASRDDHSLALLWFARAVQLSHDEPAQQEINRIRMANWLRQVWLPEATFTLPEFRERQDLLRSFQFSPDGKYLLVLPTKGDCLVWDCQASRLVVLPPVAARSLVAAWQPRGGLLAVADKEGPIRFLAPPEFRPVGEVVAKGQVTVLAFSRDGNRLAWGGVDGARVWDLTKKMDVSPFFPHGAVVAGLSFSASGNLLATATRDNKARVFRIGPDSAEPLFPPVEHVPMEDHIKFNREWLGEEKQCALFADNDRVLLTASNREDRTQLVWRSTTTGKVLLAVETPYLSAFSVNPDGTKVAVIGIGTGRLWDASSRQFLAAIPQSNFSWCEDVRFSADGQTLTTGNEAEVHFWSVFDRRGDSLSPSSPFILHPKQVVRATHSPDGQHLAVALWDGRICLWHMPQGPPLTFTLDCGHPNVPAVSPDHSFVLPRSTSYREATQKQVRVYEAESGKAAGPILDPGGIVIDAAFNPEGTRVASASLTAQTTKERKERIFLPEGKAGNIQIWNWKSGERVAGPVPMPTEPRGLAYRPDGKTLAVVCADYRVLLLDPKDGRILHHLETGVHPHRDANLWWPNGDPRFSPDGRFLVTWEAVPFVQVWDPDQGRLLHRLDHEARIHQVAFSPTSSVLLATACRDRVARIWDLESGKLLKQMLHPHEVLRVRFSPDGKELITSCEDGSLRVWDWQQEKLLYAHSQHRMPMRDFGITADQRWLVTLGNQELQVTDWQTRSLASPLWNLPEPIRFALALAGEDHRVIVGGFSDSLEAYDLKAMTTPAPGAAEDLVRLAELAAGRRILPAGQVIPLNSAEWAERWERLQQGAIRGNSAP